jgi:hypothetical protein
MTYYIYQINRDKRKSMDQDKLFNLRFTGDLDFKTFEENYVIVGKIKANDLDHVFEIGNIGPEQNIIRSNHPMHSISVGDVIFNEQDKKYSVVQSFGFKTLEETA